MIRTGRRPSFSRAITSESSCFEDDSGSDTGAGPSKSLLSKLVKPFSGLSIKSIGSSTSVGAKMLSTGPFGSFEGPDIGQRELRYVRNAAGETILVYETSKYSSIAIAGTLDALLAEVSSASSKLTGEPFCAITTITDKTDPSTFTEHLIEYHSMDVTHGQFLQAIIRNFWNCCTDQDARGCLRLKSILTRWISQRPRDFCTSEAMQEIIFIFTSELRADNHFGIGREIETALTSVLNADARLDAHGGKAINVTLDRAIAKASLTLATKTGSFEWSNLDLGQFVRSLSWMSLYLARAILVPETINHWMRARLSKYRGSAPALVALNNMRKRNMMLSNWVRPFLSSFSFPV